MAKATKAKTTEIPLAARVVADMCGVELKTVHNWARLKLLDYFRTPGRHLRFRPADVERFMANGYHRAEPKPVPDAEASVIDAAVLYAKKQTKPGLARLKKAVEALPEAS